MNRSMPEKPAKRHLKSKVHRLRRTVKIEGLGLHFIDAKNSTVRTDERNRKRNWRVLHPEAHRRRAAKNKQHAMI